MTDFEKYLLKNDVPIREVVTPFERLLLRLKIISRPVGMLSYAKRAIWFSLVFTVGFLGTGELILRSIGGISLFTSVPPKELGLSILGLLTFGPITALFWLQTLKKHGEVLRAYRDGP